LNIPKLEILSLGRNRIKKITGLTFVSDTLKQLWISYNEISSLEGVKDCVKLECLYIGNNLLASYNDLNIISNLTNLQHAVFKGNPFAVEGGNITKPVDKSYVELISEVKKRIPSLMTLDGELCKISDSTGEEQG
jgi:dynein light chain 1